MISSLAGASHLVSASIVKRGRKIPKSRKSLLRVAQTAIVEVFPAADSIDHQRRIFFFFFNFDSFYMYSCRANTFDNIYEKIYYCHLKICAQALIKCENVDYNQ